MGVVECLNHKLVEPFKVLFEKEGEHQLENMAHSGHHWDRKGDLITEISRFRAFFLRKSYDFTN